MSDAPVCPCDVPDHPRTILNPPQQSVIRYRAGDYLSFRDALLRGRAGEAELINWAPGATGDLAVQMIEWWAYIADILTFYDERVANQQYLRTADLPESVHRLIRLLGYRPRPAIGAHAALGALLTGVKPVSLPAGFQVQSKPGPGKQPQIFELDQATKLTPPSAVAAQPVPNGALFAADGSVLLAGAVQSIKPGDALLIMAAGWSGADDHYAVVTVRSVVAQQDPQGRPNTRLQLATVHSGIPAGAQAADYQLLRSTQSSKPWPYNAGTVIDITEVDLDGLTRDVAAGTPVLFDIAPLNVSLQVYRMKARPAARTASAVWYNPPSKPQLVSLTAYGERVWFANPKSSSDPSTQPEPPTIPIPILHSVFLFTPTLTGAWDWYRSLVSVRHGWQAAGTLIATPARTFDGTPPTLMVVPPATFPQGNDQPVLIEDANGAGISATGRVGTDTTRLDLTGLPDVSFSLVAPLRVLLGPLAVSRGQTVASEVLGSGDASAINQSFVLKNKPLTYLPDAGAASGDGYTSTLRVWVDGIEWHEQPSFYDRAADARVFVTRENETQATTLSFGDGVNGARLTTGSNNVVASYRYGAGQDSPDAGTLTVILKPMPGLQAVRNPVAAVGGADPDPPDKIRTYAPRSVLAFGRAVSGDDYEVVAAQAPGVARARAYFGWDAVQQRAMVLVYVGDDAGAADAARSAIAGAADPNRHFAVQPARLLPVALTLTVLISPDRAEAPMRAALLAALADPDTGLFGSGALCIGASVYHSMINDACLDVPGTVAVHGVTVAIDRGAGPAIESGFRFDPGEGGVFTLTAGPIDRAIDLTLQAAANAS